MVRSLRLPKLVVGGVAVVSTQPRRLRWLRHGDLCRMGNDGLQPLSPSGRQLRLGHEVEAALVGPGHSSELVVSQKRSIASKWLVSRSRHVLRHAATSASCEQLLARWKRSNDSCLCSADGRRCKHKLSERKRQCHLTLSISSAQQAEYSREAHMHQLLPTRARRQLSNRSLTGPYRRLVGACGRCVSPQMPAPARLLDEVLDRQRNVRSPHAFKCRLIYERLGTCFTLHQEPCRPARPAAPPAPTFSAAMFALAQESDAHVQQENYRCASAGGRSVAGPGSHRAALPTRRMRRR